MLGRIHVPPSPPADIPKDPNSLYFENDDSELEAAEVEAAAVAETAAEEEEV
jgi:hypothetical protein